MQRPVQHVKAKAWSIARACHAFERLAGMKRPEVVRVFAMHVAGLYLVRVPLLTLFLLLLLPSFAFGWGRSFLENLFVELSSFAIALTTLVTFMTAVSAVSIINAVLVNGEQRFPGLPLGKYYGGPFYLLGLFVPLPLVFKVVGHSGVSPIWSGLWALGGFLVAVVLVLWIRVELDERGKTIGKNIKDWEPRYLFYPFPLNDAVRARMRPFLGVAEFLFRRRVAFLDWLKGHGLGSRIAAAFERLGKWLKESLPLDGYLHVPSGGGPGLLYSAHRYLLLLTSVLIAIWVVLFLIKVLIQPFPLPALAFVVFSLWLACMLVSCLAFLLDPYRVPILTAILFWTFFTSLLFGGARHVYRTDSVEYSAESETRLEPASILARHECEPVVLVAAAGGGIQAAAWTSRVLTGLAEGLETFGSSIVLLSGVSGGSVGIYYFADVYDDGGKFDSSLAVEAYESSAVSSLPDVAWGFVGIDIPGALLGWKPAHWGRGWALERALSHRSRHDQDTLFDWEEDVAAGIRPAVMFSATLVESGLPLLFSTTRMQSGSGKRDPLEAVDFRTLPLDVPDTRANVAVATAVRLSATFPFVSPVASSDRVGGHVRLSEHVADGGYYDNFGMMALMSWLDRGLTALVDDDRCSERNLLVLQIRSFPDGYRPKRETSRGTLYQLVAPLSTLMNVRTAAQRLRNEQEFEYLRRYWGTRGITVSEAVADYQPDPEFDDPQPPLSWKLGADQREAIERTWVSIRPQLVDEVGKFLMKDSASDLPSAAAPTS